MLMKIMLALMKNERDQAYLVVIDYLLMENRVIRDQFKASGKRLLLTDEERRNLATAGRSVIKHGFGQVIQIVTPDTLMRWYRRLVAKKYDSSRSPRKPGRPEIPPHISKLILKMARQNRSWGYNRIVGALTNLGYDISDQSVANVLKRHTLEPTPERDSQGTWTKFLKRHLDVMWATDFFTVEVLTITGLVRYYVLFFIHLQTRKVVLGGITAHPNGDWMKQVARNVTGFDGELESARYLIHDRDPNFILFDTVLPETLKVIRLPKESPNLNAYAERFVRSIKEECLSRFIPLGQRFLRHVIKEYLEHYHTERNHQGKDIGNVILFPDERMNSDPNGKIVTDSRLGGQLKFYHREDVHSDSSRDVA